MDERSVPITPPEQPPSGISQASPAASGPSAGRALDDPRALTILTTEHWSLLSARALVYNEAFARAGMYLTFLSASLVALGLLATGGRLGADMLLVSVVVLAIDLFVGLATTARVISATFEDIRFLQGMNRVRHAYHELVPGLEPYFITDKHDDIRGVFAVYGAPPPSSEVSSIVHGLTTVPGMLGVVNAAVAGVLVSVLAVLGGVSTAVAIVPGVAALALGIVLGLVAQRRQVRILAARMNPRFPSA